MRSTAQLDVGKKDGQSRFNYVFYIIFNYTNLHNLVISSMDIKHFHRFLSFFSVELAMSLPFMAYFFNGNIKPPHLKMGQDSDKIIQAGSIPRQPKNMEPGSKPWLNGQIFWLVVNGCHQFWHFPMNIGLRLSSQLTKSYFSEIFQTTNQF